MRRRGSTLVETAYWVPLLFLFMFATVELGRLTYTYYTLKKSMYTLARYLGTQQSINFCDAESEAIQTAKRIALTGTADGSGDIIFPNLTEAQIEIRIERYTQSNDTLSECACTVEATGCDAAQGAGAPDYIVVTIPDGYAMPVRVPGLSTDPILLRPVVRVPYGGT